jgi:hypothetical protein
MLSDEDSAFLNRCLSEVPSHGAVTDYHFFEPEMEEFLYQSGVDETDLSSGWQAFFNVEARNACASCRSSVADCSCTDPNHVETVYVIDPNYVFREWAERIEHHDWFSETTTESIDDLNKRLIAESDSVGEVVFRVFFDGQRLENHSANPIKKRFPVGFVNAIHSGEEEYTFFWTELLEHRFWSRLHSDVVRLQNPLSLRLCRLNTDAVSVSAEEIEDNLKEYFETEGMEVSEHPQLVCPDVDEYINIDQVDFVATDTENAHKLLCKCDSDPDHWHFHYFNNGQLRDVTSSDEITEARSGMRTNITKYNNLSDSRQDLGPFVRFFAIILGLINIGPLVQFLQLMEVNLSTQQTVLTFAGTLVLNLLLTGALVYLALWPVYKLRTFDWTI